MSPAPIRRTRQRPESVALSSRLGDILERRRASMGSSTARSVADFSDAEGEIVRISPSSNILSEYLGRARSLTNPARDNKLLHVSDLLSRCIRKIALVDRLGITPKPRALSLTDSLTFAQGNAIHDVLKHRVGMGGAPLWGFWECRCKLTSTTIPSLFNDLPEGQVCSYCRSPLSTYKEVPMPDTELGIVGTPDLIVYRPAHKALHVSELKSISHDQWKELSRPKPDHVLQVMFYWALMKRRKYRLTSHPSVLYATKGWMFSGDPFKEFSIDAAREEKRLEPYLEDAKALQVSRAGGELPPRVTCADRMSTEAKKCEVCDACFGKTPIKPVQVKFHRPHRRD